MRSVCALPAVPCPTSATSPHPIYRRRTFAQNGTCPYGTRCRFIHSSVPLMPAPPAMRAGSTTPTTGACTPPPPPPSRVRDWPREGGRVATWGGRVARGGQKARVRVRVEAVVLAWPPGRPPSLPVAFSSPRCVCVILNALPRHLPPSVPGSFRLLPLQRGLRPHHPRHPAAALRPALLRAPSRTLAPRIAGAGGTAGRCGGGGARVGLEAA